MSKKSLTRIISCIFVFGSVLMHAEDLTNEVNIQNIQKNKTKIIGEFGKPLGTIVKIRGVLLDVSSETHSHETMPLGLKSQSGSHYKFKVMEVDGVVLQDPIVLNFENRAIDTRLIIEDSRTAISKKYEKLEKHFLGLNIPNPESLEDLLVKQYELLVFETGAYEGIPTDQGLSLVLTGKAGFRFVNRMIILKEL